jgi:hypothetical protein
MPPPMLPSPINPTAGFALDSMAHLVRGEIRQVGSPIHNSSFSAAFVRSLMV